MNELAEKAVKLLTEKNLILATAESCTGGLIAKTITDVSGASQIFQCGIVAYANSIKRSVLGVKNETLKKYGAVSEETVREMSQGAIRISGADVSIAVSGIAGPSSDDTNKPVGLIWIAVNCKGNITVKRLDNSFSENVRESNRNSALTESLSLLNAVISDQ
ncbi:MAG: CinA family protein [Clostridiales bacterium]|nr:CinA family protein [Clostridiales bacterium]